MKCIKLLGIINHHPPSPTLNNVAGFVAGLVNNIISPYISPQHWKGGPGGGGEYIW